MFILCSQHCHSWSFTITGGLTDSLLTVQTECTYKWDQSCLLCFFKNVSRARLNSLQQDVCTFVHVYSMCVSRRWGLHVWELDVNGKKTLLTVCFWFLQQMSIHKSWRQRQSICWNIIPYIHPRGDIYTSWSNCRYQNRELLIYTICTTSLSPILVPLQLHKYKAFCKVVHHFTHQNPHMYMMKALSNGSAMLFMFVIYTMALLKCMLSFNKYQPNMEQQEHVNTRKFQINQNQRRSQNL